MAAQPQQGQMTPYQQGGDFWSSPFTAMDELMRLVSNMEWWWWQCAMMSGLRRETDDRRVHRSKPTIGVCALSPDKLLTLRFPCTIHSVSPPPHVQDPFGPSSMLTPFGFGGGGQELFSTLSRNLQPMKVDLLENDREFCVRADVPGIPRENVKLEVDPATHSLHISTSRGDTREESGERGGYRFHRSERYSGSNYRSLRLPRNADLNNINANVANGLLNVSIPKLAGEQQTGRRRINIGEGASTSGTSGASSTGSNIGGTTTSARM
jgi:HSP20 family protein